MSSTLELLQRHNVCNRAAARPFPRAVGSSWVLARVLVLGIPAPWRDIHFPVRLEVRHVILHIVKRCSACEATPVHLPVGRPKNDVLRIGTTDHGPEQLVEFR